MDVEGLKEGVKVVVLLGLGLFFAGLGVYGLMLQSPTMFGIETVNGTMISTDIQEKSTFIGKEYSPRFEYRYMSDGQHVTVRNFPAGLFSKSFDSENKTYDYVNQFLLQDSITVALGPGDSTYLKHAWSWKPYAYVLLGLSLVLLSAYLVFREVDLRSRL